MARYEILDTEPEKAFDNLAKLAARICGTSASQINFLDKDRQWAKSTIGWGQSEMPKETGFCIHTIQQDDGSMVLPDTLLNKRFKDHPLVHNDPPLRFYAGITLRSVDRHPLGALCVYDTEPRQLTEEQLENLRILAEEVETHLKLRVNQSQLTERLLAENNLNNAIINSLPVNFFIYNADGKAIRWNDRLRKTTGYSDDEIGNMQPVDFFTPEDREQVKRNVEKVYTTGQASMEATITHKQGDRVPYIFSASMARIDGESYLVGTGQDISHQKDIQNRLARTLQEKEVLISEIHHRVKNNLAIISGLIQMEALQDEMPDNANTLQNTVSRIQSMAKVHEILYQTDSFTRVSLEQVANRIADHLEDSYNPSANLTLIRDVEPILLNINQAVPCAMIINELLANALKHAYEEDTQGKVILEIGHTGKEICLRIADEGRGLPDELEPGTGESTGLTLVELYSTQLDARIELNQESGTEFIIRFHKSEERGSSNTLDLDYR